MAEQCTKNKSDKGGWRAVNALSSRSGIREQQQEHTFLNRHQFPWYELSCNPAIAFNLKSSRKRDELPSNSQTNDFKTIVLLVPSKGLGGFIRALKH